MKPIQLKIQGLRSYRDPVEVDFAWLGASGLFGICGPTGAGKSTVLDALFLALYGDVPRNNAASEFLHPDAPSAVVELTFAVTRAGRNDTWRVRREWRRVKKRGQAELSREVAAPRVELQRARGDDWELVHDRLADVNQAIAQDVVGIPMQDFRRAVVLPQGEFDRLLRAAPKDRAQLLGRVFGLGRFGGPLQKTAQARRSALDVELRELEARLQAKNETAGNVTALEAELAAAKGHAAGARSTLQSAETEARTTREARRAAEALEAAEAEAAAVGAASRAIAADRTALGAAARAEVAWGPVEAFRTASARARAEEEGRVAAAALLVAAQNAAAEAAEAHAAAEAAVAAEEPKLAKRLENVREAERLEAELGRQEGTARAARGVVESSLTSLAALAARAESRETRRLALDAARTKAEAELARTRVSLEERDRVARLAEALAELERLEGDVRRATADLAEREASLKREREAVNTAAAAIGAAAGELAAAEADPALAFDLEALAKAGQDLAASIDRARTLSEALARAEDEAARAAAREQEASQKFRQAEESFGAAGRAREEAALGVAAADEHVRRADRAVSAALVSEQAAHLAEFLAPGKPCPVCGSAAHPRPAASTLDLAGPKLELAEAEKFLDGARARLAASEAALEAARLGLTSATDALAERRGDRANAEQALSTLRARGAGLDGVPWDGVPAARTEAIAALEPSLSELRARYRREQAAQKEAERRRQRAALDEATSRQRLASATASVAQRESEAERVRATRDGAVEVLAQRRPPLDALLGGISAAELSGRQRALAARDEQAEGLERTLKTQREALEAIGREALADGAAREEHERARAAAAARQAEAERQVQDIRARVGELAEGRAPAELGRELAGLREALLGRERQTRLQEAQAREHQAAAETRAVEAVRRSGEARANLETATGALAAALAASGFAGAEEVEAARRPAAERERLERLVREHDERRARADAMLEAARQGAAAYEGRLPGADGLARAEAALVAAREAFEAAHARENRAAGLLETARAAAADVATVREAIDRLSPRLERLRQLELLLQGEKMVAFAADRHLQRILAASTAHLRLLSSDRYDLVRDPEGAFAVRDRHQAGALRPASTLSGGESFLVSLALALALSDHLQTQGSVRFDFFFLDEGFGSLDEETLSTALDALERLRGLQRTIGTISHVPAMHERLPRRLLVAKAPPGGSASVRLDPPPG